MVINPEMTMPPETPQTNEAEYRAMMVPRSCRKKMSAIVKGAIHSPHPAANPKMILATSSLL
jgi:hypothetical protein